MRDGLALIPEESIRRRHPDEVRRPTSGKQRYPSAEGNARIAGETKLGAATRNLLIDEEIPEASRLATLSTSPNATGGTAGPNAQSGLAPLGATTRADRPVTGSSASTGLSNHHNAVRRGSCHRATTDAWYHVGQRLKNREPRIFRLDRIDSKGVRTATSTAPSPIRLGTQPFTPAEDFDLDHYLRGAWRIVVGREQHDIVLRFAPRLAPLILNAEHHVGEEKRELRDGSVEYRVRLSSLEEIARWVVGFGGGVEVVSPKSLEARALELAREACARPAEASLSPS